MDPSIWENVISRNSHLQSAPQCLEPAAAYRAVDPTAGEWTGTDFHVDLEEALARDRFPLPTIDLREGYYPDQHFGFWASGLHDLSRMMRVCERAGVRVGRYLDFGCSSGRELRHMAFQHPDVECYGCDIDRRAIEWILRHLPGRVTAFQSHSIPTLPLPPDAFDLISAFSVFTHVEAFETTWLMELRRLLRPGGLAYLTVHTDRSWRELDESIVLLRELKKHRDFAKLDRTKPMPRDPLVLRFDADRSYSSHVLTSADRIRRVWGRFLEVVEILPKDSFDQNVVVLRKA